MRHIFQYALMPLALAVVSACDGDSGLDPTVISRAEAFISDGSTNTAFNGTLTTNANVAVSGGSTWHEIGSPNGITVQLQRAGTTTVHGEVGVPTGVVTRARLTLRNAQVTIRAGSVVGGVTLTSDVVVNIGGSDGEVVIEKDVTIATGDNVASFTFDLNSAAWINAQNLADRLVDDAEVRAASSVVVR